MMHNRSKEMLEGEPNQNLDHYYRWHAPIYDLTRWSFLFGRDRLLDLLPELSPQPRILEIGCGTGKVLKEVQRQFPDGHIYGVDLSESMLTKAREKFTKKDKVTLLQAEYGTSTSGLPAMDLIILSYSLSMIQSDPDRLFSRIAEDLGDKGQVAVVDFNNTPFPSFRRWMKINHVEISGQLPTLLHKYFTPCHYRTYPAYLGLWSYFTFLGRI